MATDQTTDKPKRLYFKTYLQLIDNSIGSNLFRNFYVETRGRGAFDALDDGYNSCAFYVCVVLVIFKKLSAIHGTVASSKKDLEESDWQLVDEPQAGDVIVWEARQFDDGVKEHIGFSVGNGRAISISSSGKVSVEHSQDFDGKRKIVQIYRRTDW